MNIRTLASIALLTTAPQLVCAGEKPARPVSYVRQKLQQLRQSVNVVSAGRGTSESRRSSLALLLTTKLARRAERNQLKRDLKDERSSGDTIIGIDGLMAEIGYVKRAGLAHRLARIADSQREVSTHGESSRDDYMRAAKAIANDSDDPSFESTVQHVKAAKDVAAEFQLPFDQHAAQASINEARRNSMAHFGAWWYPEQPATLKKLLAADEIAVREFGTPSILDNKKTRAALEKFLP